MKIVCTYNNHEGDNKYWSPGKVYDTLQTESEGYYYISSNIPNEIFIKSFVDKLDITFVELRSYNLNELLEIK